MPFFFQTICIRLAGEILGWGTPHPYTLLAPPMAARGPPCQPPQRADDLEDEQAAFEASTGEVLVLVMLQYLCLLIVLIFHYVKSYSKWNIGPKSCSSGRWRMNLYVFNHRATLRSLVLFNDNSGLYFIYPSSIGIISEWFRHECWE
jgi:hypothetical protein